MSSTDDDKSYPVLREVLASRERWGGWAVEFGVWSGESMALIAQHMPVIGFDSFEGLPEDWRPEFPKGAFSRLDEYDGKFTVRANSMVVPGWFEDTVPTFPFPQLSLVHIDCDLYSSTRTALMGVTSQVYPGRTGLFPGTVVVMDEHHGYDGWEEHEAKAFENWCHWADIEVKQIAEGREEAAFEITGMLGK